MKLNDRDKAVFLVLLSKFKPAEIDLAPFGIPEFIDQFEGYANRGSRLFDGCKERDIISSALIKITENVRGLEMSRNYKRSVEMKEFMNWYLDAYQRKTGRPYLVGGKDFKLIQEMVRIFAVDELKLLAQRFLKEEDNFVKKAGYTIGVFKVMINRLASTNERRPIGADDYSKYCKG